MGLLAQESDGESFGGALGQSIPDHHGIFRIAAEIVEGVDFSDPCVLEKVCTGLSPGTGFLR